MSYRLPAPRNCGDCGAVPGKLHTPGCDVERCVLCGGQAISCNCIYRVNDVAYEDLETDHPEIYSNGPTPEMYEILDARTEAVGGPLPWTGHYPGTEECVEFGWYCYFIPNKGFIACAADHPDASPDLNRLVVHARWDIAQRRYVR